MATEDKMEKSRSYDGRIIKKTTNQKNMLLKILEAYQILGTSIR